METLHSSGAPRLLKCRLISQIEFLSASSAPGRLLIVLAMIFRRNYLIGSLYWEVGSDFITANIPLPPVPTAGTSVRQFVGKEARSEGWSPGKSQKAEAAALPLLLRCSWAEELTVLHSPASG